MSKAQKKSILIYSFSGAVLLSLMIFSQIKNDERKVEELLVEVMDEEGNYFTDEREVIDLMTDKSTEFVLCFTVLQKLPGIPRVPVQFS